MVVLGNNEELEGESAFQPKDFHKKQLSIVFPELNSSGSKTPDCTPLLLKSVDVKRKLVLCKVDVVITRIVQGQVVKNADGAIMVIMNVEDRELSTSIDPYVLPTTNVNYEGEQKILAYINLISKLIATIVFNGKIIGAKNATIVAFFFI